MFFSIEEGGLTWNDIRVSVPLRGYVFLNMLDDCYQDGISGFRPLTGICFSQFCEYPDKYIGSRFPSPYGDMFF